MDCLVIQSKPLDQRGSISILQQQLHPLSSNTSRWRVRKRTWNNSERGFSEKRLESLDIYHWAGKESNIKVCRSRDVVMDKYFSLAGSIITQIWTFQGERFLLSSHSRRVAMGVRAGPSGVLGFGPLGWIPLPSFPNLMYSLSIKFFKILYFAV